MPARIALLAVALLGLSTGYVAHRFLTGSGRAEPAALPAPRPAAAEAPADGAPLAWSFSDLDGEPVALERWRGSLLVVNFWATWCPPCLREIPAFVDLQARLGERGLQFVGIALDQAEAVRPFVAEHAMNYPVLVGSDEVIRFMSTLGNAIGGLPYTAVIGPDGAVLATHQGEWEAADAARVLEELLGGT